MSAKPPSVVVSRCDRLGDLVLSLPVLGFLRDAGVATRVLHCSRYAADVGEWARHNGLCQAVWIEGDAAPAEVVDHAFGLALFHSPLTVRAFKNKNILWTLGPRSKWSSFFAYSRSIAQHRSRVEKSEMRYNLDLARAFLEHADLPVPEFRGLPALTVPPEWQLSLFAPDTVIVVSNNGSAANWPLSKYLDLGRRLLKRGHSVDFLVAGLDGEVRAAQLKASGILSEGAKLTPTFPRVGELIAYLAAAREVYSSSTGPLHLAHAAGVPVYGIYPKEPKQETFARWRPDGYAHAAPVRYESFHPR